MKIGISNFPTDYSIRAVPLAKAAEERGFESLFVVEHTHIPASRRTPYPMGGELPSIYWEAYEPFTFLAQAAAVTEHLNVGTGICLVPEHHPIALAKRVASLDSLSGGRFLFGIGAGWNAEELENHGVRYEDRWKVLKEHILAMKSCWTEKDGEFHGRFVDFDPVWVEPKPAQRPHPPILIGASSKWAIERIVEYADGWLPVLVPDFDERLAQLHQLCEENDRDPASVDITVFALPDKGLIEQLHGKGVNRIVFGLETQPEAESMAWLDQQAEIVAWAKALG